MPVETPEKLVRARFSAFIYMKIPYLLDSTHPESKDYCQDEEVVGSKRTKKQIWSKQLESRAADMDFANLKFEGESVQDDGVQVSIVLDRKPKSSTK